MANERVTDKVRSETKAMLEADMCFCDNKDCEVKWECARWYRYAPFDTPISVSRFNVKQGKSPCPELIRREV